MKVLQTDKMKVSQARDGSRVYKKVSYPIRYGRYSEIACNGHIFQFNLNGELKHITGTGPDWPHPAEWLKRTTGNDWVYYSTGNYYAGVVDLFGEYYFPYPAYPTNCILKEDPFARQSVSLALQEAGKIADYAAEFLGEAHSQESGDFLSLVEASTPDRLLQRAGQLHRILQAKISVLPPDCRHVDYDVIPVMISDGCLYNCSFCEVKSGFDLSCRSRAEIAEQISALQIYYGPDLVNYNSVYLGQHDSLAAHPDDILFAAQKSYDGLAMGQSYMQDPKLFLFGSAESLLQKDEQFWERLNSLPFYIYVNIGLESFDDNTLEYLKKPVGSQEGIKAFEKMLALNASYENIEVTANFVLGENLPSGHIPSLLKYIGPSLGKQLIKGCVYLSPLKGTGQTRELIEQFRKIKLQSRIDTFLYLIQRL
jgi:hypothetical protein